MGIPKVARRDMTNIHLFISCYYQLKDSEKTNEESCHQCWVNQSFLGIILKLKVKKYGIVVATSPNPVIA